VIDFLIVGGGFSGIAFSWELEKKNISYKLADPVLFNSATAVSGGLINPVTGRRSALQWNIQELLTIVKNNYLQLENILQCKLLYNINILKIHKSESALEDWQKAQQNIELLPFINDNYDAARYNRFLDFRFGAVNINSALRIDISNI
jgi:hypothetical protein